MTQVYREDSLWIIPFGAHRGPVEDAPGHYLRWLLRQEWFCRKFDEGVKLIGKELKFREDFKK
jgi:uncharacterized protein (DUF3820 family)